MEIGLILFLKIFVGAFIFVVILKKWPKTGRMGINLKGVACPSCGEPAPPVRKPNSMRQFLWGGWTCKKCGTEMDKYGEELHS